jgi:hypothetical protein
MNEVFRVVDDFSPVAQTVRDSALQAGFGTWQPSQGYIGSSRYEGMGFWGRHADMIAALSATLGCIVLPNSMFFRVTKPGTEAAYIHSDREAGAYTCIAYLSEHDVEYGTAFWRHRATGLLEMPSFAEMQRSTEFDQLRKDIVSADPDAWERGDFVRGAFNRALIFRAPLFHSRVPNTGLGERDDEGRLVWACHFHTLATLHREDGHG